jgi:hypothetical protein
MRLEHSVKVTPALPVEVTKNSVDDKSRDPQPEVQAVLILIFVREVTPFFFAEIVRVFRPYSPSTANARLIMAKLFLHALVAVENFEKIYVRSVYTWYQLEFGNIRTWVVIKFVMVSTIKGNINVDNFVREFPSDFTACVTASY